MKPAFAHLTPTVPATLAAGIGISLSVFLLPGAVVQSEPTPLLSAIGGAAGRVAADLPAPAHERASEPVRKAAPAVQLVATRTEHVVPQRRHPATKAHRVHHRARARVVRRAQSAPVQVAAPAAPATPVTTLRFFSTPKKAKGKARGHSRTLKPTVGAPAPRAHGHGKALGRPSEHHHGLPPGHAKKAPAASSPAPAASPKNNGGGNGNKRGKK